MEGLHLIVGLGNPGTDYAHSRHNIGFMAVEQLASRWHAGDWGYERRFNARLVSVKRDAAKVLLGQPQTYMNSSGEAVAALVSYYRVPLEKMLIVVDDADLPLGELRLRPGGGSGGHHGLESVERHLGTTEYPRLRVGIGRREGERQIANYVLGRFGSTEAPVAGKVLVRAVEQAECWVDAGIQKAMNQFNGVITLSGNEGKEQ